MYLGVYRFAGDPAELLPAYERLTSELPADASALHACVVETGGITIYDTCPDRETFERFSTGPGFRAALAAAGLPWPSIEGAPVHTVRVSSELVTH